jgi:hypothetical protein
MFNTTTGSNLQRVEGIDELKLEEPFERRSHERTTLYLVKEKLKGKLRIQNEKQALKDVMEERDGLVFWTDGLRKENEWVGCTVEWKEDKMWKKRRVHLGQEKEAFNVEMYAMSKTIKIVYEISNEQKVERVMVFMDSQVTLKLIQLDEPGPGQALELRMMNWKDALLRTNIQVEFQAVPAYEGIEGNEEVDQQVFICIGESIPKCKICFHFYIMFLSLTSIES